MVWTLVLQPLPTSTMHNGQNSVFGLHDRKENLVIVLFIAVRNRPSDEELVNETVKGAIDDINQFAAQKGGTADRFRYLNWCDEGQQPFHSYGEENVKFLKEVSRAYDPEGLFQRGCVGGFKLGH